MNARGFTLIETIIALSITGVALTALAELFVIATETNASARRMSFASVLATQKVEELRSLGTDLVQQGTPALDSNIPDACDFIDRYGRSLGACSTGQANMVYVRRWSVEPLAADPQTFVLQVAVFPLVWRGAVDPSGGDARTLGGAHIVTITRRAG